MSLRVGKGYYGGNHDPMIRDKREIALEPVQVVIEFTHEEFALVNRASHALGPSDYLKRIALERIAAEAWPSERLRARDDR